MAAEKIFEGLKKDGPNTGDYAIKENGGIIAHRIGLKSPSETRIVRLTIEGRTTRTYEIGDGKYASALVVEAMLLELGIHPSGKAKISVDAKFLGKLRLAMGEQIWSLAEKDWNPDDHFVAGIRQSSGPTQVWAEFK